MTKAVSQPNQYSDLYSFPITFKLEVLYSLLPLIKSTKPLEKVWLKFNKIIVNILHLNIIRQSAEIVQNIESLIILG